MQMGTRISMGRARWSIEDASIFSGGCNDMHGVVDWCLAQQPDGSASGGTARQTGRRTGAFVSKGSHSQAHHPCLCLELWSRPDCRHCSPQSPASAISHPHPRLTSAPAPAPLPLSLSARAVSDGKRLAQEPPPMATHYERIRLNKVARAAYESPTMAGLR
jgi:hypothetical protein